MNTNYPTKIEALNDFQTRALVEKISNIVSEYNLEFKDEYGAFKFLFRELNFSLNIEYSLILEDIIVHDPELNYFQWLCNYIDKLREKIDKGGDILMFVDHNVDEEDAYVEGYSFFSWDILTSNIDLLESKSEK